MAFVSMENLKEVTPSRVNDIKWSENSCIFSFYSNGIHNVIDENTDISACAADKNENVLLVGTQKGEVFPVNFPCIVPFERQFRMKVHLHSVDKIKFHKLNRFVVTKSKDSIIVWETIKRSTESLEVVSKDIVNNSNRRENSSNNIIKNIKVNVEIPVDQDDIDKEQGKPFYNLDNPAFYLLERILYLKGIDSSEWLSSIDLEKRQKINLSKIIHTTDERPIEWTKYKSQLNYYNISENLKKPNVFLWQQLGYSVDTTETVKNMVYFDNGLL